MDSKTCADKNWHHQHKKHCLDESFVNLNVPRIIIVAKQSRKAHMEHESN
ncbi:hypothetical protein SDC9_154572 [bioreactor metagenome]|uniref:Uncharacterized protein n=1 Tax=bioreactor metagenome TaxID=1076179 RepID=A0A645F0U9_9ZZZZ